MSKYDDSIIVKWYVCIFSKHAYSNFSSVLNEYERCDENYIRILRKIYFIYIFEIDKLSNRRFSNTCYLKTQIIINSIGIFLFRRSAKCSDEDTRPKNVPSVGVSGSELHLALIVCRIRRIVCRIRRKKGDKALEWEREGRAREGGGGGRGREKDTGWHGIKVRLSRARYRERTKEKNQRRREGPITSDSRYRA